MNDKSSVRNTLISFSDVSYNVNIKSGCCSCFKPAQNKTILSNINGIMRPGLNAIMGPTGSGKSSLLDILAGRKDPKGLSGKVLINGGPLPKNFKRISGYVIQNDICQGTLTVRENLWFSANLRLPKTTTNQQKEEIIENSLLDLNLSSCADTRVGTEFMRGISGGERKRTCIAIELITDPSVLFLDEPTTGLDASTAHSVILLLKKLSVQKRTIIFSIHQPRYSIFRLFDSLTLLSMGQLVYHGKTYDCLPYFAKLGYECEKHNNPADFILDVINGDSTVLRHNEDAEKVPSAEKLVDCYKNSDLCKNVRNELNEINEKEKGGNVFKDISTYATPFLHQLNILLKRSFYNVIRNPVATFGTLVVNIFIGVLFGLLYYQIGGSATTGTQNRFGVLFFISTNLLFSSLSAVQIFIKDKELFVHEYVSGYYRVISYFLARLFAELIPMRTLGPIIFCSVTYWMVGLKHEVGAFFLFLLMVLLIGYSSVAVCLFYSTALKTYEASNTLVNLTFVFAILFSGLLLNLDTILPWLAWIQYISISKYGFTGLAINEFRGKMFNACLTNSTSPPSGDRFGCSIFYNDTNTGQLCYNITGECFLASQLGIGDGTVVSEWQLWQNYVALFVLSIGLYFLSYVNLARTKIYS